MTRLAATAVIGVLLLAGCKPPPDTAAADSIASGGAVATSAPAAATPARGQTLATKDLIGSWRVNRVLLAPGKVQAYATDDPAIVGAVLAIGTDQLRWAQTDGTDFTTDDVCTGPALSIVVDEGAAQAAATPVLAAFAAAQLLKPEAKPMIWACTQGGQWGPAGSNFMFASPDGQQIVLQWYDNLILLLERQPQG